MSLLRALYVLGVKDRGQWGSLLLFLKPLLQPPPRDITFNRAASARDGFSLNIWPATKPTFLNPYPSLRFASLLRCQPINHFCCQLIDNLPPPPSCTHTVSYFLLDSSSHRLIFLNLYSALLNPTRPHNHIAFQCFPVLL